MNNKDGKESKTRVKWVKIGIWDFRFMIVLCVFFAYSLLTDFMVYFVVNFGLSKGYYCCSWVYWFCLDWICDWFYWYFFVCPKRFLIIVGANGQEGTKIFFSSVSWVRL